MLESRQQKLVSAIEQYWYEYNSIPTVDQLIVMTALSETFIRECFRDERFSVALRNRGLDLIPSAKLLSPEQLALANSLLDFADDRPTKSKLAALNISARQYSAWLKQTGFKQYLNARAEQLFGDALPEAHSSLVRQVQRGDMGAIKLFYEMSGRWSSKTVEETNIEFLMMKLIEIIQRHVTDPIALGAIAEEIGSLVPSASSNPPVGALPVLRAEERFG